MSRRRPLLPVSGSRKWWTIMMRKWSQEIGRDVPKNRRRHRKCGPRPDVWPRVEEYASYTLPGELPRIFGRDKP